MDKAKAKELVANAKLYAGEGDFQKSLKCFHAAYKLYPSEKTLERMKRIEVSLFL